MAYKVLSFIVVASCHTRYALADFKAATQIVKAMSKTFVSTRHMPGLSGSVLGSIAGAAAPENAEVVTGSSFLVHQAPSNNQLGSTLHIEETLKKQHEEHRETYLRGREQKMLQADAAHVQYGFGFGSLIGLMAVVGLLASIGFAAARRYFAHGQNVLQSTVEFQISTALRSRPIRARASDAQDQAEALNSVVGYFDHLGLSQQEFWGQSDAPFQPAVMLANPESTLDDPQEQADNDVQRLRRPEVLLSEPPDNRYFDSHPVPSKTTLLHPHNDFAHRYWAALLKPGDTVVDATVGNGHDAAFLAEALGSAGGGTLLCMDVQAVALERSRARVRAVLDSQGWYFRGADSDHEWLAVQPESGVELVIRWLEGCHVALLSGLLGRSVALVVFNLGYLPGGDKSFTTTAHTTVPALVAAEHAIAIGGCVSATIYSGHKEGLDEEVAVLDHAAELPQGQWSVYHTQWLNQRNKRNGRRAPSLVLLQLLNDSESILSST